MIKCIGGCGCSFHPQCIGLGVKPADGFKCDACTTGVRRCFKCDQTGELVRCTSRPCSKWYHPECAHMLPRTKCDSVAQFDADTFVCPLHTCANCDLGLAARCGKLVRCVRCPVAYHEACLPAGIERKEKLRIVCPRHTSVPPKHPSSNCCMLCGTGGELIICDGCPNAFHENCVADLVTFTGIPENEPWYCHDCVGGTRAMVGDIVWGKVGAHRWWPGQIIPEDEVPDILARRQHDSGDFPVRFFGSHDYYWLVSCRHTATPATKK